MIASIDDLKATLPRYRCHKIVQAAAILDVLVRPLRLQLQPVGAPSIWFQPRADLAARYVPLPGDYLVIYDDGYVSVSPAKAFEAGYSRMAEEAPAAPLRCGASFMHEGERGEGRLEKCGLPAAHDGGCMTAFDAGERPARHTNDPASVGLLCMHRVGDVVCLRREGHEGPHDPIDHLVRPTEAPRPGDANDGQFT